MDETGNLGQPEDSVEAQASDPNAQAPVSATGGQLVSIPLTPDQITEWWDRVEGSREARKRQETTWNILMKEYIPKVTEGGEDIKSGIHFRNVHTKIPKLFFKNPELTLTPEGPINDKAWPAGLPPPPPGMPIPPGVLEDAAGSAPVFQAVLNKKLGRKGVNVKGLVSECLFDVLTWAGLGFSKLGYRNVVKTIQEPVMQPDPNFIPPPPAPGSILGLESTPPPQVPVMDPMTGQPVMQPRDVVIFEEWYWNHFSPNKSLLPDDLRSSKFDRDASWMGMEFVMPEHQARATFKVPDGVEIPTTADQDDNVYKYETQESPLRPKKLVKGVELWYKASIFDPAESHPQAMRQLVLIDGAKETVFVHRPSPDQTFDAQGRLTPDSLVGFPFVVFSNRDMADTPWVLADNAFTNSSVKHVNTHRRQSVQLRDANIGKYLYDTEAFTPDDIERFKKGNVGEWIGVKPGQLSQGQDKILAALRKNEASRDDWRTAQILKQDIEEMIGMGGVSAGATEETVRTATEISTSASALASRMEEEQGRILDCFLDGVEKFAALIQRYADDGDYVEIVGKDNMKSLVKWDRTVISARWAFDAKPDSQLRVDVARDRAQLMQFLETLGPFAALGINPMPVIKKLATAFHVDPSELAPPMPPPGMLPPPPGAPPGPGGPPPGTPQPPQGPGPGAGPIPNAPAPGAGTESMIRRKEGQ